MKHILFILILNCGLSVAIHAEQTPAIAAFETMAEAHQDMRTKLWRCIIHAASGKDASTDYQAIKKAVSKPKEHYDESFFSYNAIELVEAATLMKDWETVTLWLSWMPTDESLDALGLAAVSFADKEETLDPELNTLFDKMLANGLQQVGKPNEALAFEGEETPLFTHNSILTQQWSWYEAWALTGDRGRIQKALQRWQETDLDPEGENLQEFIAQRAHVAASLLWFDPKDELGLTNLKAIDLILRPQLEAGWLTQNSDWAYTWSSWANAVCFAANDEQTLNRIQAALSAAMDHPGALRWLLADRIRFDLKNDNPARAIEWLKLGYGSLTLELIRDPEGIDWLEWDMHELARAMKGQTVPKDFETSLQTIPQLYQQYRFGAARGEIFHRAP